MSNISTIQNNPLTNQLDLKVKPKQQDNIIRRVWNATLAHMKTRDGLRDFMRLGFTTIDWVKVICPKAFPCAANLRRLFATGNNVAYAMQMPESVIGFGETLVEAAKQPSKETAKKTVLSGLGIASPLSTTVNLLQEAKVVNLSREALRGLSYFSNTALVVRTANSSIEKTQEIYKQANDYQNSQNESEKKVKGHILLNSALSLGTSSSFFGIGIAGLASLLGAAIAPPIFLALGTNALVCSLLGTYHKSLILEPQKAASH